MNAVVCSSEAKTTQRNVETIFWTFLLLFKPSVQPIDFYDDFKYLKASAGYVFKTLMFEMSQGAQNTALLWHTNCHVVVRLAGEVWE